MAQGQGDIDLAHQQLLHQLAAVQARQFALGLWMALGPLADHRGEQRQRQRRRCPHAQGHARLPAQAGSQAPNPLYAVADLVDFALQRQGLGGDLQLAAHPQEQREAQLCFGMLEYLRHRWLSHVQQLRGAADGAGLADGLEHFDMTQAHGIAHNLCLCFTHFYSLSPGCHRA
ncbi:hypothetical protein D3C76_1326980 [compost metagenome]